MFQVCWLKEVWLKIADCILLYPPWSTLPSFIKRYQDDTSELIKTSNNYINHTITIATGKLHSLCIQPVLREILFSFEPDLEQEQEFIITTASYNIWPKTVSAFLSENVTFTGTWERCQLLAWLWGIALQQGSEPLGEGQSLGQNQQQLVLLFLKPLPVTYILAWLLTLWVDETVRGGGGGGGQLTCMEMTMGAVTMMARGIKRGNGCQSPKRTIYESKSASHGTSRETIPKGPWENTNSYLVKQTNYLKISPKLGIGLMRIWVMQHQIGLYYLWK